ncbi:MAG: LptF/LptG family permease [Alphaproteobacteria bacterium]|nr:LptF/LptG family permease [Alphaproteobacteria bacterium]
MIKTIDKYIFKQLLLSLLLMALVFCGAILLSQSLQFIDMTVNEGASFGTFLQLIFFSLPKFFIVILPISLLIVTMFIYSKMMGDNEIVIMKSSGVSNFNLSRAAVFLSVITALLVFALDGWVAPASKEKIDMIKVDIVENQTAVLLQDKIFNDLGNGLSVYVEAKQDNGNLTNVFIKDAREKGNEMFVTAKSGAIINDDKTISLTLVDGMTQIFNESDGGLDKLEFKQYTVDLKDKKPNKNKIFKFIKKDADERNLIELIKSVNVEKDDDLRTGIIGILHYKLSAPFLTISFILIALAFILGGVFRRTGYSKRMGACFLIVLVLQSGAIGLSNFSRTNVWACSLMYLWAIIPGLIGVYFICRKKAR